MSEYLIKRTTIHLENLNKKRLEDLLEKIAFDLECGINYSIHGGKTIAPIKYVGKKKKLRTRGFIKKIEGSINKIEGGLLKGTQFECFGEYDFGEEESFFNRFYFLSTPNYTHKETKKELALIDEVREYISNYFSK